MISVCMAVHNGECYLQEQIESILSQLTSIDELIIVDDASTDNSVNSIELFTDSRIKLIRNPSNFGVVKSFEKSIIAAKGDFIFLADQDDIWIDGKVTKIIDVFRRDGVLAIVSNAIIFGTNNKLNKTYFEWRKSGPGFFKNLFKNRFLGCCMAFDKKAKEFLLPFPAFIPMHDEWIGLACSVAGDVAFIDEPLMYYRRHNNNVSNMHRGTVAHILTKRIKLVVIILSRITKLLKVRFELKGKQP